eukprot:TRINITY_DN261_c0_g1_i2.p1 TRINITY_DN261_c0_g1~~TRINITY_DN261_c0_g1_i2.p1  ORF type:complete len:648 (+),score=173.68 TRINITY_DN261_c0_g1_i2:453-2396(+)
MSSIKPQEPPPNHFILDIPEIPSLDLDIIKLTAQFVARNGKYFQMGLASREHKNPQFEFLNPKNSLHSLYNALVESYTRVFLPPRNIVEKLMADTDKHALLDRDLAKMEWERVQRRSRKTQDEEEKEERMARSMIDWHSFVVVETIEFESDNEQEEETPSMDIITESEQDKDVEMETEDDEDATPGPPTTGPAPPPVPSSTAPAQKVFEESNDIKPVNIRKNWTPAYDQAHHKSNKFQVCPMCKQLISVDEMDEHMRIELLDPRYQAEKKALLDKKVDSTLAVDEEIARNLNKFAKRRGDIFEEAEDNEPKAGDEEMMDSNTGDGAGGKDKKKIEKVIWDGHTASISRTSNAVLAGMSLQDQIAAIHATKGLNKPDEKPPVGPVPLLSPSPQPQPHPMPQPPPSQPLGPGGAGGVGTSGATSVGGGPGSGPSGPGAGAGGSGGSTGTVVAKAGPVPAVQKQLPQPPLPNAPPRGMMGVGPGIINPYMMGAPQQSRGILQPPIPNMDMSMAMGVGMPGMNPLMPLPTDDEPLHKKQKLGEGSSSGFLQSEDEFLASCEPRLSVQVQIPQVDKSPWSLQGQLLSIDMDIKDTVAILKEKIKDSVGIPANKQNLKAPGLSFFKDQKSLAFYNLRPETIVNLNVKGRGGRN